MKWFKHMTDARDGETMSRIFDKYGFAGVGMYWTIIEVVASHWDGKGEPALERSLKSWRKLTGIYPKTFVELLRFLRGTWEVPKTFDEKAVKVCIPKLLKIRDEYSRKSGHTPDKVAPEEEVEERKKNKEGAAPQSEPCFGVGRDGSPIEFKMPLVDNSEANITTKSIERWEESFRYLDVRANLSSLIGWFDRPENRDKRWDRRGWFNACAGWLAKRSNESKSRMAERDPSFSPSDPDGSKAAMAKLKASLAAKTRGSFAQ